MNEIWKDINGYNGIYKVSNLGRIKSIDRKVKSANQYGAKFTRPIKGKILKPFYTIRGYEEVTLYNGKSRNFLVHRLVANAFLENPNNLEQVNHKDGNKKNNNINNLEWCNAGQNQQHAIKTGLKKIKKVYQYDLDRHLIKIWDGQYQASEVTHIAQASINRCCNGKQKTTGGYVWEYENK